MKKPPSYLKTQVKPCLVDSFESIDCFVISGFLSMFPIDLWRQFFSLSFPFTLHDNAVLGFLLRVTYCIVMGWFWPTFVLSVFLKCHQSFWCRLYHLHKKKRQKPLLEFWNSEAARLENVLPQELKTTDLCLCIDFAGSCNRSWQRWWRHKRSYEEFCTTTAKHQHPVRAQW